MVRRAIWATLALTLAGCNSGEERIEELEDKVAEMESQRSNLAGSPVASPTASASTAAGPAAAPETAGNVCTDGEDRSITLVNRGEQSIMYFYASPPTTEDWEEDILGDDVVVQNESYRINFNTDPRCTCVYDTKAELADGTEIEREVNVCTDHRQTYP